MDNLLKTRQYDSLSAVYLIRAFFGRSASRGRCLHGFSVGDFRRRRHDETLGRMT